MKKFRSRLAVVMMLTMVFVTSFELVGVFAEEDPQGEFPEVTEVTEETTDPVEEAAPSEKGANLVTSGPAVSSEPAALNSVEIKITYTAETGGTVSSTGETVSAGGVPEGAKATPKPGYMFKGWYKDNETDPVTTNETLTADVIKVDELIGPTTFTAKFERIIRDLEVLSSANSVHLRWKAENASGATYTFTVNGSSWPNSKVKKVSDTEYRICGLDANINCFTGKFKKYDFTVTASKDGKTAKLSGKGAPVRTIAYKIKIKTSGTLKSHNSIKGKIKVKAGQYIYAYGFGCGGKYLFKDSKGSLYFCNFTRTSKRSCVYSKKVNYTDEEATLFVNDAGFYSKNNYLVWVNTYTQHIYLFRGSKGKWHLNHPDAVSAECASGKASSPSPTSAAKFGRQTICRKIKTRHGIPYWSCYSDINAIHAKKSSWKMGAPASNGCVRNLKTNAQKIYKHAANKKTKVYLY